MRQWGKSVNSSAGKLVMPFPSHIFCHRRMSQQFVFFAGTSGSSCSKFSILSSHKCVSSSNTNDNDNKHNSINNGGDNSGSGAPAGKKLAPDK